MILNDRCSTIRSYHYIIAHIRITMDVDPSIVIIGSSYCVSSGVLKNYEYNIHTCPYGRNFAHQVEASNNRNIIAQI